MKLYSLIISNFVTVHRKLGEVLPCQVLQVVFLFHPAVFLRVSVLSLSSVASAYLLVSLVPNSHFRQGFR